MGKHVVVVQQLGGSGQRSRGILQTSEPARHATGICVSCCLMRPMHVTTHEAQPAPRPRCAVPGPTGIRQRHTTAARATASLTAAVLGVLPLQLLSIFQRLPHRQLICLVPLPVGHALAPRRHGSCKGRHLIGNRCRQASRRRLRRGHSRRCRSG